MEIPQPCSPSSVSLVKHEAETPGFSPRTGERTKVIDMETRTITIRVSPEAARAYETAPAEQQRKLDILLSLKLTEVGRCNRPLEVIMSEISRKAAERGLTETILESILDEQ